MFADGPVYWLMHRDDCLSLVVPRGNGTVLSFGSRAIRSKKKPYRRKSGFAISSETTRTCVRRHAQSDGDQLKRIDWLFEHR